MKLETLTPMLRTWDLDATVQFYREALGFLCEAIDKDNGWASLSRDGVTLMLSGPNAHEEDTKPAFTGSFYFHTDDVDTLWEHLHDKVRVCYPIEDFFYGIREFGIYDNNGYVLRFGQKCR